VTVILVRHAWAGDPAAWTGDDLLRPLDERGRRQAQALIPLLRRAAPARLLSSPAVRCADTLRPYADDAGLPVELDDALTEERSDEGVALVGRLLDGPAVAVCTHGTVVEAVIEAHVPKARRPHDPDSPKGSAWELSGALGAVTDAHYIPPPA